MKYISCLGQVRRLGLALTCAALGLASSVSASWDYQGQPYGIDTWYNSNGQDLLQYSPGTWYGGGPSFNNNQALNTALGNSASPDYYNNAYIAAAYSLDPWPHASSVGAAVTASGYVDPAASSSPPATGFAGPTLSDSALNTIGADFGATAVWVVAGLGLMALVVAIAKTWKRVVAT